MTRYYAEEPCEHGKLESHQTYIKDRRGNIGAEGPVCPGGSRRELTIDYEAAAQAIRDHKGATGLDDPAREFAITIVHAALGNPE